MNYFIIGFAALVSIIIWNVGYTNENIITIIALKLCVIIVGICSNKKTNYYVVK